MLVAAGEMRGQQLYESHLYLTGYAQREGQTHTPLSKLSRREWPSGFSHIPVSLIGSRRLEKEDILLGPSGGEKRRRNDNLLILESLCLLSRWLWQDSQYIHNKRNKKKSLESCYDGAERWRWISLTSTGDEFWLLLIKNISRRQSIVWPLINSRRTTARPFEWERSHFDLSTGRKGGHRQSRFYCPLFPKTKFWRTDVNEDRNSNQNPVEINFVHGIVRFLEKNNNIARFNLFPKRSSAVARRAYIKLKAGCTTQYIYILNFVCPPPFRGWEWCARNPLNPPHWFDCRVSKHEGIVSFLRR